MKRMIVAMVVGALALTACAQRGTGLGASVPVQTDAPSEKADPKSSHKKDRSKAKKARSKAEAPVLTPVPQEPMVCSSATGGGDYLAQLTEVRVGTHQGYDRITFEFAPPENGPAGFGIPRYRISRLSLPITEDGSGRPVAVDGREYAGIVFQGGTGVDMTTSDPKGYKLTYTGPREIKTGFGVLAEAQETGDFEATMSWAFGLNRESCWKVLELQNPTRVVVDFLH